MITDLIIVSSEGDNMKDALEQVEKAAVYKELSTRDALHLRLLTEEMMAMVRTITGGAKGEFWMEDENGVYELHLKMNTTTDSRQRAQLLASSKSGKNEATKGFMGKLRWFFDPASDVPTFSGSFISASAPHTPGTVVWTMEDYRLQLDRLRKQKLEGASEAWDELEKSVVSKIADDVKVSIREREVEMVIIKKIA